MFFKEPPKLRPSEVIDYLRKSRSDDPFMSVEEVLSKHEKMLDEWAEKHLGGKVPNENKFREVVSGETLKERPEINKVLRLIESPNYKAVKVVEPQRLTRGDYEDIGRLMKLLKHTHTLVITPQRIYDLQDDYDWDAFERELKRGNDYLEYTKKILNRGRLLSVSQGNYIGNCVPYGFKKATVMDGKRKCPTLAKDEATAPVVQMIFDLYVNKHMGKVHIANYLNELKIPSPKGNRWQQDNIIRILNNVHYAGKVRWNGRKTVPVVKDGQIHYTRPRVKNEECLIFEGKHEGLVPEEMFNKAQAKNGRNHRAKPSTKLRNPLASLVHCRCGKAMTLRTYKKDGKERGAARLLCIDQAYCKTGSCLYEEMLDYVIKVLEQSIEDFEVHINNDDKASIQLHEDFIKGLEMKLQQLEEKELAQWEAQANPDPAQRMPAHIFAKLNDQLLKEKHETEEALSKARETLPEPVNYERKVKLFSDALKALREPEVDAEKANALLKQCIERIDYSRPAAQRASKGKGGSGWAEQKWEAEVTLRI